MLLWRMTRASEKAAASAQNGIRNEKRAKLRPSRPSSIAGAMPTKPRSMQAQDGEDIRKPFET